MIKKRVRILLTYLYSIYLKKNKIKIASSVYLNSKTIFGGCNIIHSNCTIVNTEVGFASYLGPNCILPNVIIGKYCSIASNVKVLPATHPTKTFVSSHPSFFSLLKQSGFTFVENQKFQEILYLYPKSTIHIKIGNDVWIGDDVKIIGGIEIGDGAIVAAGSIITKNVPPYAVMGGIPAKVIRYRFNEEQITFLSKIKWWEKDPNWLSEHSELFLDIEKFIYTLKINNE
jgi:acetyltransferase-like isoleucine patch superfamily enzyme